MALDRNQRTYLGLLAIIVLGMGSWFAFLRDSGPVQAADRNAGKKVVRVREDQKTAASERSIRKETNTSAAVDKERRERDPVEREELGRKTRSHKKDEKKPKKTYRAS